MPGPEKAPNDWPAAPRSSRRTGPRSSPRSSAPVSPAPNERSAVVSRSPPTVTGPWSRNAAAMRVSSGDAGAWRAIRAGRPGSARRAASAPHDDAPITGASSARAAATGRSSRRLSPMTSPTDRAPTAASSRRRSSATARKNRSTISGVPVNLARRSSRWVAMPVGHVSRWHWRAMSHPTATSAAVPNANSSAPSRAATSRSRPVCRPPSVRSATRSRRSLRRRTWWTSARPSSHGAPTCLIELSGDAPVPPAWPERWMYVAPALATPAATVPTPRLATSLTPMRAAGIDRAQVGDELGEVLDRIDVVVGRRADVALAGLAAPKRGDVGGRLAPGELATLAGLGALRDLDLQLVGTGEIRRGHAEPRRGDLLDARVVAAAIRSRRVPGRVLAALAGVRGAAGALDPDRQGLVRLRAQGAHAHRRHDEAAGDRARVLDALERERDRRSTHAELVARHRRRIRAATQGGPIARERGIDRCGGRLALDRSGQDLDLLGDAGREEMRLAIGPEARPARVRQARLATGGASAAGPRPRLGAASARSPRSARVVRPGHAAAFGKQRAMTSGARSTVSISVPPM